MYLAIVIHSKEESDLINNTLIIIIIRAIILSHILIPQVDVLLRWAAVIRKISSQK